MRITRLSIENFRCFAKFVIDLDGESRFFVGDNAVGKSSLITAIGRALGRDRDFHRNDFLDENQVLDIRVSLTGLDANQLGIFVDAVDFGPVSSLTVGIQAAWDPDAEEAEILAHGYPTKGWKTSNRSERDALDVYWIADDRDPSRFLQFGGRRGLLANILASANLTGPISTTINAIKKACDDLANVDDMQAIMLDAGAQLRKLLPAVGPKPFDADSAASTELAVLRQLQLVIEYAGPRLPLADQSSGVAQLSLFAFALISVAQRPGSLLLIDEPELSLHPQCQRALLSVLQSFPNQCLITTHSASLLDRADPRRVVRLHRDKAGVKEARPAGLSNVEALRLARYTTPQNAEAFFAQSAILVEGVSDRYVIDALAFRMTRNLDAEGVTIVVMEGAGGINTFLTLLGPTGLRVKLAGLCDAGEEASWAKAIETHGLGTKLDRAAMAKLGFFVFDKDLEDVLVSAVGLQATIDVIDQQGESVAFVAFSQQPTQINKSPDERVRAFLHSRGRQITYAPLLVDRLDLANLPGSLAGILNAI